MVCLIHMAFCLSGKKVRASGLEFNVVDGGSGEAVVFLHGFPDNWTLWRHQVLQML